MKRWVFLALGLILLLGLASVATARFFGRKGARASALLSVVVHWLAAWVLWSLAGGLAVRYGLLATYDATLFGLLVVALGAWHYRLETRLGREQGLLVFLGGQLAWLLVVLYRNGLLPI